MIKRREDTQEEVMLERLVTIVKAITVHNIKHSSTPTMSVMTSQAYSSTSSSVIRGKGDLG